MATRLGNRGEPGRADTAARPLGRRRRGAPRRASRQPVAGAHDGQEPGGTPGRTRLRDDLPGRRRRFPKSARDLRFDRLADTLDHLAHAASAISTAGTSPPPLPPIWRRPGSPVTRVDLRRHEARLTTPLTLALDDATLFNTPPPTQGLASLIILGLFDRLRVTRGEGFDHVHGLIEATKRAFTVRDAEVDRPGRAAAILRRFSRPRWLERGGGRRSTASVPRRGHGRRQRRHHVARRDRPERACRLVHPVTLSGSSDRAWCCHKPESSGRIAAHPSRSIPHRSTRSRPAASRSTRSTRRWPASRTGGRWFMARWAATGSRSFRRPSSPATPASAWTSAMRSTRRVGGSGARGGRVRPRLTLESRFDPDLIAALERAGHGVAVDEAYSDADGARRRAGAPRATAGISGASDPRSDGAAVAAP